MLASPMTVIVDVFPRDSSKEEYRYETLDGGIQAVKSALCLGARKVRLAQQVKGAWTRSTFVLREGKVVRV